MTTNQEIWDSVYSGMFEDMKKAYGVDLDPNGFIGQLCKVYADTIVKAMFGTETYQVRPGQMAPHMPICTAVVAQDPSSIPATSPSLWDAGLTKARTMFKQMNGDRASVTWEECTAAELVPGDVVTHIQVGRQWVKCKQQNGDESAGFRVTESWFNIVFGYVLLADGSTPASENALFSLDNPARLRVVPWDARPAAVKADPSKWNGTCARCGRGTYTGFTSTEHDGPCE